MSCIIADSGPLIALAGVDLLHLPTAIYGRALVTRTVLDEVLFRPERVGAQCIEAAFASQLLITCDDPVLMPIIADLRLDPGEASALALALEAEATVLLDEVRGRRAAQQLEIPVVGVCGLLLIAKRQSLVSAVRPLLQEIRHNGYFLSETLMIQVAGLANE